MKPCALGNLDKAYVTCGPTRAWNLELDFCVARDAVAEHHSDLEGNINLGSLLF